MTQLKFALNRSDTDHAEQLNNTQTKVMSFSDPSEFKVHCLIRTRVNSWINLQLSLWLIQDMQSNFPVLFICNFVHINIQRFVTNFDNFEMKTITPAIYDKNCSTSSIYPMRKQFPNKENLNHRSEHQSSLHATPLRVLKITTLIPEWWSLQYVHWPCSPRCLS